MMIPLVAILRETQSSPAALVQGRQIQGSVRGRWWRGRPLVRGAPSVRRCGGRSCTHSPRHRLSVGAAARVGKVRPSGTRGGTCVEAFDLPRWVADRGAVSRWVMPCCPGRSCSHRLGRRGRPAGGRPCVVGQGSPLVAPTAPGPGHTPSNAGGRWPARPDRPRS